MNRMHELLQILADRKLTLGSVESMTGGLFAAKVTEIPGASKVFKGSLVTYSAELKEKLLGIEHDFIEQNGVVSDAVAAEMARKGRVALGVDVALAVTGNAGPDAEPGKAEVGTVCFALATKDAVWAFPYQFRGERNEIRAAAVDMMVQLALGSFPAAEKK